MAKELSWYPRPPDDTGFGVHGSASNSFGGLMEHKDANPAVVAEQHRMGVRWKKLVAGADNALDTSALLLANGIMPIIRFYVAEQWPRPLSECIDLADLVRLYVAAGVRYFQVGNEPNLLLEWQRGWGSSDEDPTEWKKGAQPDRVADAFAIDARIILDNGGIPITAPLAPGGNYNDIDWFRTYCQVLRDKGHAGLLQEGIAIGAHPGTLNHPLDYPFDKVNQDGEQLSREEYERHSTWAGSLEWVNEQRRLGKNPGQHLLSLHPAGHPLAGKDSGGSNCWLKWRAYHDIWVETFGFDVPVISLEGGVWVGEKLGPEPFNDARIYDPRYPAVSKERHKEWILAILRQFSDGKVPEYLFNVMFWLDRNQRAGGTHQPFERDAWWSHYWDNTGGRLPIVDALLASPALPRKPYQGDTPEPPDPEPTQLTDTEIAAVCMEAGWVGEALVTAIAVCLAESGGRVDAVNEYGNTPPSRDRGLFQINDYWHPEISDDCAFDALCNASAAYDISEGGENWFPWAAYNAGTYEAFLDRARAVTCASWPTAEQIKNACWNALGVGYNPDAALAKYAAEQGLGVPLSPEHVWSIGATYYIGQPFVGADGVAFVWCVMGDWGNVTHTEMS